MKNTKRILFNAEGAKFSLLVGILALFSLGTGCTGSFNIGNANSETTNKVEDNRMSDNKSAVNAEKTSNSKTETSNTDSAEKPDENVEKPFASDGELPNEAQLQAMTTEILLKFNDAVQKGDFTDFHGNISSVWKKTSTPETFNQGFKEFIDKKIDISTIKGKTAEYDPQPTVVKKSGYKVLSAKGNYDTSPLPTRFDIEYIQEGSEWKLISIRVDTRK